MLERGRCSLCGSKKAAEAPLSDGVRLANNWSRHRGGLRIAIRGDLLHPMLLAAPAQTVTPHGWLSRVRRCKRPRWRLFAGGRSPRRSGLPADKLAATPAGGQKTLKVDFAKDIHRSSKRVACNSCARQDKGGLASKHVADFLEGGDLRPRRRSGKSAESYFGGDDSGLNPDNR